MKILEIITDGYEELEALGTLALLRRSHLDVTLAGLDNTCANGIHNIKTTDLVLLDNVNFNDYDMLLIPGGPEYIKESQNLKFLNLIRYFYNNHKYIAAICAGPTILGHLGLLRGKNYTCFTSMNEDFGGKYLDQYVVKDGNLITARSCSASIDFALEIIKTLQGEEQENKIKQEIYY